MYLLYGRFMRASLCYLLIAMMSSGVDSPSMAKYCLITFTQRCGSEACGDEPKCHHCHGPISAILVPWIQCIVIFCVSGVLQGVSPSGSRDISCHAALISHMARCFPCITTQLHRGRASIFYNREWFDTEGSTFSAN